MTAEKKPHKEDRQGCQCYYCRHGWRVPVLALVNTPLSTEKTEYTEKVTR